MKALPAKLVVLVLVTFSAAFLMIVVAAVMTWAMGWVTAEQVSDIRAILRGETLERPEITEPVIEDAEIARERALLETLTKARKAQEEDRRAVELDLERRKAEFQVVRQDAQRMMRQLDAKLKELTREKEQFRAEKEAYQESLASEGLRKLKEVLEALDASEAAQMLYDYDMATTVNLLRSLKRSVRADILSETHKLDRTRGLQAGEGRATQILKMLGDPKAVALAGAGRTQ